MCTICGCGHDHDHHDHSHDHEHMLRVEQDILSRNDHLAAHNREHLEAQGIAAFNLMSSPGSGKTTLLCRTIDALRGRFPVLVIEGDQQTDLDAARVRATGAPAFQVNTGKGCHLDAGMVGDALAALAPPADSLLFIENVGNLVCPAAFDLGEAARVVVLSVTEGDDKPLKYPDMFHRADLMVITKTDLAPHVDFDPGRAVDYARRINPAIGHIGLSAKTGEGMEEWLDWIIGARRRLAEARIARLEAGLKAARESLGR